jgi:PucR C-terminal helix-turn-helix domain
VSLRGRADRTSQVAVFDGSLLATAAISAPEVMVKSAGTALDGFSELPDEQRQILFDTFRVWQENDASVSAAAERLTCHPNTVRHRLRRIEKHTGRSLPRPRDVAELCLAFEVHRRLFEPKPRGCENDRCRPVWCGDIFMERHRFSNPIKQMGDKRG